MPAKRLGRLVGPILFVGGFALMLQGLSMPTIELPALFYLGASTTVGGAAVMLASATPRGRKVGTVIFGSVLLALGIGGAIRDWIGRGIGEAFEPQVEQPVSFVPFIIGATGIALVMAGIVMPKGPTDEAS